jgi:Protein of unknown function (DUF2721)
MTTSVAAADCATVRALSSDLAALSHPEAGITAGRSMQQPESLGPADMDLVPDAQQLARVMSQATAPAFVLGAVAGFVSILLGRMTTILDRIRSLNEITDDDAARAFLKSDIPRLRRRAKLLNDATRLALASGMCTALLLVVGFLTAFLRLGHEYGAAVLFVIAVGLLAGALFKFTQEVRIGLSEADHHR